MTPTMPPFPELKSKATAFEGLLQTLSSQPAAQYFIAIAHENAELRTDNGNLKEENTTITRTIQRLRGSLDGEVDKFRGTDDELKRAIKGSKDLEAKLLVAESKWRASEKKAANLEVEMKQQHEAASQEAEAKDEQLENLQQFFVKLTPTDGNQEKM